MVLKRQEKHLSFQRDNQKNRILLFITGNGLYRSLLYFLKQYNKIKDIGF